MRVVDSMTLTILMWLMLLVIAIFVLFGLYSGFGLIVDIWIGIGWKTALFVATFMVLVIALPLTKEYAPQYHFEVGFMLFIYTFCFLIYRFTISKEE